MKYFLGIDGGGTKTAAAILNDNAEEIGRGQGGPCNIATCDDETLRHSVTDAVKAAQGAAGLKPDVRFEAVWAGVAGYTAKRRRAEFTELLKSLIPAKRHRVEPDYVIAYWGATEGEPGIIVSAGTGAVVYGRNQQGETAKSDGWGFLLGDRGSAFDIGCSALTWLIRNFDINGWSNSYYESIAAAIGASDADDVVEWAYLDFSPSKIATLVPIIAKLATEGDRLAMSELERAAYCLGGSVYEVSALLKAKLWELDVYLLGGLWLAAPMVSEFLAKYIRRTSLKRFNHRVRRTRIQLPRHDAAFGAALLAISRNFRID